MLQVPTKMLLLAAAAVWLLAGASVSAVGVSASPVAWDAGMALVFLVTFLLFVTMFLLISRRHIKRITSYTARLSNLFKFFDAQSYLILVVMVAMGAAVRLSGLVPGVVIAPFYSGIGAALLVSAVFYAVTYVALSDEIVVKQA
ncbi:MAG: hypothetical protein LBD25_02840 [Coriobacteriales bacterium]|jgi:hypothetical protein|nr:hypothetical protein [Coriobacteriales bacterium]